MSKRLLVDCLTRNVLLDVAASMELDLPSRATAEDVRTRFTRSRRVTAEDILEALRKDDLQGLCGPLGRELDQNIPVGGTVGALRKRLLAHLEGNTEDDEEEESSAKSEPGEGDSGDEPESAPAYRDTEYEERFWQELTFHPKASPARPYQTEAVQAALKHLSPQQPCLIHVATGGGKTRIGNDAVVARLGFEQGWSLWVTKDWRLLKQAARDLSRRHRGYGKALRRLGGEGTVLHPLPQGRRVGTVIYTTIQTLGRRLAAGRRLGEPSLVVWDECHWGEHGQSGRELLSWCEEHSIPVLGLTATPRPPSNSRFHTVYSKDFASLVREGYLARPVVEEPVRTGVAWSPRRAGEHADFTADSLRELAQNATRNHLIVSTYDALRHGKTIVFACTVEHADELARLFNEEAGIPARAIHSQLPAVHEEAALAEFERGEVRVLVNVAKLTTGVDVPDARSVFLCRPTLSDILFSQMVGRASRLHEPSGKTSFHMVEFTDNVDKFGDQLQQPQRYFVGFTGPVRTSASLSSYPRGPRLVRPAYDPKGEPRWLDDSEAVPEVMRGLWYRHGQTFGVEFELTRDDHADVSDAKWRKVAKALRQALAEVLPGLVAETPFETYQGMAGEKDHGVWNIERDTSCGWEVTSRILCNAEGFAELSVACEALEKAAQREGLRLNHKTGTHLHLGWLGKDIEEVKRAIHTVRLFEPALATLVAPSRIVSFEDTTYDLDTPNGYCQPVSRVFTSRKLAAVRRFEDLWRLTRSHNSRYVSFNIKPLEQIHTVEIRLHNGTVEARKLLPWVSLWQQLLWVAAHREELPAVPDCEVLEPEGDIVDLLRTHGPRQPPHFLERIHRRRQDVLELWREHPALAPWLRFAERWTVP